MSSEYIFEINDALYDQETGNVCMMPKFVGVLIRCKDCKYYHKEWDGTEKHHHEDYWCEWVEPDENDFCSLAERRSDEN